MIIFKERKKEQRDCCELSCTFVGRDDNNGDDARDYFATSEFDQWVEFVDAFGRTRSCMNMKS